jgi:hypothetical protein
MEILHPPGEWKNIRIAVHTMADFSTSCAPKGESTFIVYNGNKIPSTIAYTGYRPATVPFVPNTTPQPVPESCMAGWVPFGPGTCRKL